MEIPEDIKCSPFFRNLFGGVDESKPKPIKFKALNKGANKIRIDNPLEDPIRHFEDPIRHFSASSPSDPLSGHTSIRNTFNSSRPPVFLHIEQDHSVQIRVLSDPIPYIQYFIVGGERTPSHRYLTHVIDRNDNNIKVWSFGRFVANKIREQQVRNAFAPRNQDIIVAKCFDGRFPNFRFPGYNLSFLRPTPLGVFQASSMIDLRELIESSPNMSFNP